MVALSLFLLKTYNHLNNGILENMGWAHVMGSWDGLMGWAHGMGSCDGLVGWARGMGSWDGLVGWFLGWTFMWYLYMYLTFHLTTMYISLNLSIPLHVCCCYSFTGNGDTIMSGPVCPVHLCIFKSALPWCCKVKYIRFRSHFFANKILIR